MLTTKQKTEFEEYSQLYIKFDTLADMIDIQGDCECEKDIEKYTFQIFPEGADDYTICLNCGGCCCGSEGYYA